MISFKCSHIASVSIPKLKGNSVENKKVSLVELDVNNEDDYELVREIGLGWDNGASFACDLFNQFAMQKFSKSAINSPACKFFLLTDASKGAINYNNALAVASIYQMNSDTYFIPQVQVNPAHKHGAKNREFNHVGKKFMASILANFQDFNFKLYPSNKNAEIFFERLHFKKEPGALSMILKR